MFGRAVGYSHCFHPQSVPDVVFLLSTIRHLLRAKAYEPRSQSIAPRALAVPPDTERWGLDGDVILGELCDDSHATTPKPSLMTFCPKDSGSN